MLKFLRLAPLLAVLALAGCGSHQATTPSRHQAGPAACPGYQTAYGCAAHSPSFGLPPKGLTLTPPSTVPTVAMYDSVNLSTVPANPSAVAGYLSGNWPTWLRLAGAFPHAIRVPVAIRALPVYPSLVGRMVCLDVEPGDAVPAAAGPWARGELGLGVKPCIYANLSTMPAVRASVAAFHLARSSYFLWDADWTFSAHLDSGFDATQWTDHAFGRNLDASQATRAFLGINPPPAPLPICLKHRMSRSACHAAKAKIASDQRAAASSGRAYAARGCAVLSQRVSWYSTQLKHHPNVKAASRRRALSASRTAYRQRSCAQFNSRRVFFDAAAATLAAAS